MAHYIIPVRDKDITLASRLSIKRPYEGTAWWCGRLTPDHRLLPLQTLIEKSSMIISGGGSNDAVFLCTTKEDLRVIENVTWSIIECIKAGCLYCGNFKPSSDM